MHVNRRHTILGYSPLAKLRPRILDEHDAETRPLLPTHQEHANTPSYGDVSRQPKAHTAKKTTSMSRDDFLRYWSRLPVEHLLVRHASRAGGLTCTEAQARSIDHGFNEVVTVERNHNATILLATIQNPSNVFLALCLYCGRSPSSSSSTVSCILLAALTLSCALTFWQESRSTLPTLKFQLHDPDVQVDTLRTYDACSGLACRRPTHKKQDPKFLVPGDLITLTAGHVVPADCRLVRSDEDAGLEVCQFNLTGSNQPVVKTHWETERSDDLSVLTNLPNVMLAGTRVTAGTGDALVLATGERTYMASVARKLQENGPQPWPCLPDRRRILNASFPETLLAFTYVMLALVVLTQTITRNTSDAHAYYYYDDLFFAAAAPIGALPQLARALADLASSARHARALRHEGAALERPRALRDLGAVDVLCLDTAGTLLAGERTALRRAEDPVTGERSLRVFSVAWTEAACQAPAQRTDVDEALLGSAMAAPGGGACVVGRPLAPPEATPYGFARGRSSAVVSLARVDDSGSEGQSEGRAMPRASCNGTGNKPSNGRGSTAGKASAARRTPQAPGIQAEPDYKFQEITKGTTEALLQLCSLVRNTTAGGDNGAIRMTAQLQDHLNGRIQHYEDQGYRVQAVASRRASQLSQLTPHPYHPPASPAPTPPRPGRRPMLDGRAGPNAAAARTEADMSRLLAELDALRALPPVREPPWVLEGLLVLHDPVRPGAAASLESLAALGVRVKVLTGGGLGAARRVCREVGLGGGGDVEGGLRCIGGAELEALRRRRGDGGPGEEAFREAVRAADVMAGLTPAQKGEVVRSLRGGGGGGEGMRVGVLGGGISDCVALRAADVGISAAGSHDVARGCAGINLEAAGLGIVAELFRVGRKVRGNFFKYLV